MVNRFPIYQSTNLPIYQTTNLPIYQSTNLPAYQSTSLPNYPLPSTLCPLLGAPMQATQENRTPWLDRPVITNLTINWETLIFTVILILGIVTRFYDLEPRVMSHDENSHVYYSWRLSEGMGYQHTPLTHGPLLFHLTAFSFFLFGDNDFTARIPFALFSIATIGFIWCYRRYLGRAGTLAAAGLMLISPFMLFYGRYVRNEALVALFGVITIWAVLRYLETGEAKYTYWLTAATVLHFTAKETAFIYTAQALLFLGLLFVYQITQDKKWEYNKYRKAFIFAVIIAFVLIALTVGISIFANNTAPLSADIDETASGAPPVLLYIPIALSGLTLLLALYFAIRGLTWEKLRANRSFGLMILLFTLILPQLAPIPVRALGWNPTDYSYEGMIRTGIFVVILAAISIIVGYLWNPRLWLINAAIFYIPFTILYTTVFTNGSGFFTGLVGSLGYWLEQQGVERGSQPWYYYTLVQIPIYEFLPALGCWLAAYFAVFRRVQTDDRRPTTGDGQPLDADGQPQITDGQPQAQAAATPRSLVPLLLGFWVVTSVIAYAIAGEKMPWLTVHIALPMILLTGWALGQLIESIDWKAFCTQRGLLMVTLMIVFVISFSSVIGSLFGPNPPFQGKELDQLNTTNIFFTALLVTIASGWGVGLLLKNWGLAQVGRIATLTIFAFLGLLTARAAFRAAYINYDNATEYLVYAHSARGPKEALEQIEELSKRTTDGLDMVVAYDDETTYPYWWYLRNYPNQKYYGANPTRELQDAPVILVGDNNFAKIEPVVGQAYYQFDYLRILWPNQDYYNLTWERIKNDLTDPQMRSALFQIWYNRDYSQYAEITGKDMSLPKWEPSDRMRLYVRKDIAAQVWNYGVTPVLPEDIVADPYEGKDITLPADNALGFNGSDPGQFEKPRDVALALDGTLYVADTGNHRIQHLSTAGEVLHVWGTFADSAAGDAPPGTFYEPWGIAVGPDGSVFVTDTWNHRVQKFTPEGQFITQWGYFGQAETGDALWGPRDVAVDADGLVYVTDTGNKRVVIFDSDGIFIAQCGSPGMIEGQLDEPVGVAIGTQGQIYVADTWNQRIQVFARDASGLSYAHTNDWNIVGWFGQSLDNKPYLAVDDQDRVFVSDPEGYRILEFDGQGKFVRYWGDYGAELDGFNLPAGMAVDSVGGLWVTDAGNHRILHFTPPAGSVEGGEPEDS
ncbi:MAG: TIGR03663 family protein [Chloroflexi bacterium]|nr:TIGR03663 family protein [Chloroflexota bacterium]